MKLFGTFFVLVLVSVTFLVPAAYAKGNIRQQHVVLEKNEIVNHDYFAAGDTVTISGTVNGDAYVAGGTVLLDGTVNGDLFVAGGMLTIRGKIKNDLRAVGGNMTLAGPIGGNVTLAGGNVTVTPEASIVGSLLAGTGNLELLAPVGRGVTAGVGNLVMNAPVGGDMLLGTGQLTMQPKARVAGDLTYWSEEPVVIQGTATVAGTLTYHDLPKQEKMTKRGVQTAIGGAFAGVAMGMMVAGLISMLVLGLILRALLPSFTGRVLTQMRKNPWGSFGLGIVTTIALPIVAVVLFITVIGIPVGVFLFMALWLLCLVGHIYSAFFIGQGIFTGLKAEVHHAWHLLAGLVVLGILTFIPLLGWLARAIFILIGVGALLFEKQAVYRQMRAKHLV